jgi:hypothetical protein
MLFVAICAFVCVGFVSGAIEAHRITKLPGFQGDLPSTHYSGCTFSDFIHCLCDMKFAFT